MSVYRKTTFFYQKGGNKSITCGKTNINNY